MFELREPTVVEYANSFDPDEAAYNEQPHLDLHCLSSRLEIILHSDS